MPILASMTYCSSYCIAGADSCQLQGIAFCSQQCLDGHGLQLAPTSNFAALPVFKPLMAKPVTTNKGSIKHRNSKLQNFFGFKVDGTHTHIIKRSGQGIGWSTWTTRVDKHFASTTAYNQCCCSCCGCCCSSRCGLSDCDWWLNTTSCWVLNSFGGKHVFPVWPLVCSAWSGFLWFCQNGKFSFQRRLTH